MGVYLIIYGRHVAPKYVNWKNDAIMQIEVNLATTCEKHEKKLGLQTRKINVKILFICFARLHSHFKKKACLVTLAFGISSRFPVPGNAVACAFLTCFVFGNPQDEKRSACL